MIKNDAVQGNKKETSKAYYKSRRASDDAVDAAMRIFHHFHKAFFINNPANVFYLTGVWDESARVLLTKEKVFLLLGGFRELIDGKNLKKEVIIRNFSVEHLRTIVEEEKITEIGFLQEHLTVSEQKNLRRLTGVHLRGREDFLREKRREKTAQEIAFLRQAAKIGDQAIAKILPKLQAGVSEKEFAWLLEQAGREAGAEEKAFKVIVAFGANTSNIHHTPTDLRLDKNMPILLDFGFQCEHYCADMSRSFFYGTATAEWHKAYEQVLTAQKMAEKSVRIGEHCATTHEAVVNFFRDCGEGRERYFPHGTGHGVGLEIHELPRLNTTSKEVFAPGMVFTLEPGLYFPGRFGVRIEDTYILDHEGLEALTKAPKVAIIA